MNTLRLYELAGADVGDVSIATYRGTLEEAAECIEKLRAHCRAQRRELRRLYDALQRRPKLDDDTCRTLADVPRSIRSLENAVRGWSSATALATRQLTGELEKVARFVGAVPAEVTL